MPIIYRPGPEFGLRSCVVGEGTDGGTIVHQSTRSLKSMDVPVKDGRPTVDVR